MTGITTIEIILLSTLGLIVILQIIMQFTLIWVIKNSPTKEDIKGWLSTLVLSRSRPMDIKG